jgi:biotin transporter BioY
VVLPLVGKPAENTAAAAPIVIVCDTDAAAAYVELPAWLAMTVQVPALTAVKVVPLTVHTLVVLLVKVTARPELAVPASVAVLPTVGAVGALKVMVCASPPIENVAVTGVAAAYEALPDWLAVIEQEPMDTPVAVLPLTVHTVGVVLA